MGGVEEVKVEEGVRLKEMRALFDCQSDQLVVLDEVDKTHCQAFRSR